MDITIVNYMQEQLRLVTSDFKRHMYDKLPWEARLVGLMGPRGVGKSTAAGEFLPLWSFGLMY